MKAATTDGKTESNEGKITPENVERVRAQELGFPIVDECGQLPPASDEFVRCVINEAVARQRAAVAHRCLGYWRLSTPTLNSKRQQ